MNAFVTPETTMTPEEAEALVRRLAEQAPSGPSVAEVAEALRLPPEQVARMLAEVRATPKATKLRRRTTRRERRVWLLSGICAVVLAGGSLVTAKALKLGPFQQYSEPFMVPPDQTFNVTLDGTDIGFAVYDARSAEGRSELPHRIDRVLTDHEAESRAPQPASSLDRSEQALNAIRAGRWEEVPDVRFSAFEIRRPDAYGHAMRWAGAKVPIYVGNDAAVAEAVAAERDRLVAEAVEKARKAPVVAKG